MALKETIRMYVGLPGILAKARETFNFTHAYPDGTSKTYTFPKGKYSIINMLIASANTMIAFYSNKFCCGGRIDSKHAFLCF